VACRNDEEEPAAVSKPEASQSLRSDEDVHQQKSYDLGHSPALDEMIGTLLPSYFTSQLPSSNSVGESSLPSRSDSLRVDSLDSDSRPETHHPNTPGASATMDPFDRSN